MFNILNMLISNRLMFYLRRLVCVHFIQELRIRIPKNMYSKLLLELFPNTNVALCQILIGENRMPLTAQFLSCEM